MSDIITYLLAYFYLNKLINSTKNKVMRMKNTYYRKTPPKKFEPDKCHWTRTDKNRWKTKVTYETEDDAEEWLKQHPKLIAQGMKSYFCPICNKWHCGHNTIDKETKQLLKNNFN